MTATHEVTNQATPLADYDAADDATLLDALHREGADWAEKDVQAAGILGGSAQALEWARSANRNPPELHTHDRFGHRVDEVEFHPAWHELMRTGVGLGLTGGAWRDDRPGAHVARAAKNFVWGQAESGHVCPIEMTYAAVPALRHAPDLAEQYEPLLASTEYQFGLEIPLTKRGLLAGMSMTEKQAVVLPAAPGAARRHPQRDVPPAPEGQAREQVERLGRAGVRAGHRLAGR